MIDRGVFFVPALALLRSGRELSKRAAAAVLFLYGIGCVGNGAEALEWRNLGPGGGSFLWAAAFDPTDSGTVYFGGDIEGPLKTVDGGDSYRRISNGIAGGNAPADAYAGQDVVVDPAHPSTVFLASWQGLFRSLDGGDSWSRVFPAILDDEGASLLCAVAVSPHDSNVVLAGFGNSFENEGGRSEMIRRRMAVRLFRSSSGRRWECRQRIR